MHRGLLAASSSAATALIVALAACDEIERDAPPRSYTAPPSDSGDGENNPITDATTQPPQEASLTDAPVDGGGGVSPATLSLTGWWGGSYAGSPWLGLSSAGTSVGRDLVEAVTPPIVGTAVNGFTPANFDGTKTKLASTAAVTTYLSNTAWEAHGLFSADTAPTYVKGTPYNFPAILSDSINGYFYVAFSTGGVMAGHYGGGVFNEIVSPCPTGGLHVFQAWYDGTKLNLVIDGGIPAVPVAVASPTFGTGLLKVGANYNGAAFFAGRILEIMTAAQLMDATARSNIRRYFNQRYATAFPL